MLCFCSYISRNVPLGSLSLSQNRVPCNCEAIKVGFILTLFADMGQDFISGKI